ncbi:MAG: radical SAM protein [Crocinitomix sp.]|nr:radical SAM protein [Crocinitomix sp.]
MSDLNKSICKAHTFSLDKRHADRIAALIDGEPFFPELLEVFPSKICNHNCIFCISAETNNLKGFMDPKIFYSLIKDASKGGTSRVRLCGGGEPLLHSNIADFIKFTASHIDSVSLITHGVNMKGDVLEAVAKHCDHVRISLDAGNSEVYAKMHGTSIRTFDVAINNIINLIEKRGKATTPIVELSFVAMNENIDSLDQLIKLANRIKPDAIGITTNTLERIEDQFLLYEQVQEIVKQNSDTLVEVKASVSHPDTFKETSEPCPSFLLYGLVTAEGRYFSSCHHVGLNINSLGSLTDGLTFKTLLSKPEVIQKQLKYAFGKDIKTDKLCKHPYNYRLMELIANSENAIDRVTTWMSENIEYELDESA